MQTDRFSKLEIDNAVREFVAETSAASYDPKSEAERLYSCEEMSSLMDSLAAAIDTATDPNVRISTVYAAFQIGMIVGLKLAEGKR